MRCLLVIISSIGLLICGGCSCPDLVFIWEIEGRVVDAESGQPIIGRITGFVLFRDGLEIGGGRGASPLPSLVLDIDGGFLVQPGIEARSGCGFGTQPDESEKEPPDEIEIVILRDEGGEISILLPVSEENIEESGEIGGMISLGLIEVSGG